MGRHSAAASPTLSTRDSPHCRCCGPPPRPAFTPGLQDKLGVGPVSGGQLIVSWSHHGRCRPAEAALTGTAGAAAVNRQLDRALHDIALTRWRMCQSDAIAADRS
ncbi:hypothetical protein [Rhodococcus opacus]|uniref:Transposase n=1 Tax=Rhodococcus opacus TaxID=37919 RepID=A0A076EFW7_RHOOP|nr:hypothetical protein [Rhodococcus opacus]AII04087.1 hypothetical protein EP51_05525 [Rhodococcus opacus]